jgi:hypothetical protein
MKSAVVSSEDYKKNLWSIWKLNESIESIISKISGFATSAEDLVHSINDSLSWDLLKELKEVRTNLSWIEWTIKSAVEAQSTLDKTFQKWIAQSIVKSLKKSDSQILTYSAIWLSWFNTVLLIIVLFIK